MAEAAMPLQNRVTPDGSIVAHVARGTVMGNRGGAIHRPDRTLGGRQWASRQWICCQLEFNGRRRALMQPGRYTELFFLDEATALAAGHRPCGECRRQDFLWFARLWAEVHSGGSGSRAMADEMDAILHSERLHAESASAERGKRTYHADIETLPGGSFIRWQGAPHLVLAGWLLPWTFSGYGTPIERPAAGSVEVLTPPSIVAVLSAGFCPSLHPTAHAVD
jgi:hypothetical protein